MALQKPTTHKGIECDFWIISSVSANRPNKCTEVVLRLYVNEAAFTENEDNYLDTMTVRLERYLPGPESAIYDALKIAPTSIEYDDRGNQRLQYLFQDAVGV